MSSARHADRAYFCPQCGHAIRPAGPDCPDCQAVIALPPLLAQSIRSSAEALVTIRMQGSPLVRPPSLWLQIGARIVDLALLGALTFGLLLLFIRRVELVPLVIATCWIAVDALIVPLASGTLGMRLMGLALVDQGTGRRPDLVQAMLRLLGSGVHVLTLGVSAILPWIDPEERGWPERLAGLRIVERGAPLG